jgi:hypothetical protein
VGNMLKWKIPKKMWILDFSVLPAICTEKKLHLMPCNAGRWRWGEFHSASKSSNGSSCQCSWGKLLNTIKLINVKKRKNCLNLAKNIAERMVKNINKPNPVQYFIDHTKCSCQILLRQLRKNYLSLFIINTYNFENNIINKN